MCDLIPAREGVEHELSATLAKLGDDEARVVLHLAKRLLLGQETYGRLDLARDPRDWRRERAAELADALIYGAFHEVAVEAGASPTPRGGE